MVIAKSKEDLAKKESSNRLKKNRKAEGYYWKSPGSAEAKRNTDRSKENIQTAMNIDDSSNQKLEKFGLKNLVIKKELANNGNQAGN